MAGVDKESETEIDYTDLVREDVSDDGMSDDSREETCEYGENVDVTGVELSGTRRYRRRKGTTLANKRCKKKQKAESETLQTIGSVVYGANVGNSIPTPYNE